MLLGQTHQTLITCIVARRKTVGGLDGKIDGGGVPRGSGLHTMGTLRQASVCRKAAGVSQDVWHDLMPCGTSANTGIHRFDVQCNKAE